MNMLYTPFHLQESCKSMNNIYKRFKQIRRVLLLIHFLQELHRLRFFTVHAVFFYFDLFVPFKNLHRIYAIANFLCPVRIL